MRRAELDVHESREAFWQYVVAHDFNIEVYVTTFDFSGASGIP